ncbi:MAG: ABC transporter permease [Desulfovibrio sp.]|jgi:phospholipid/cholesterol/gamma-HCH transport system permease protein|nr:ABC transporter permease [Desulfovibrio sp.]
MENETPSTDLHFKFEREDTRLILSGALTVETLPQLEKGLPAILRALVPPLPDVLPSDSRTTGRTSTPDLVRSAPLTIDLRDLKRLDTAGALFLNQTGQRLRASGCACVCQGADGPRAGLLRLAGPPDTGKTEGKALFFPALLLERLGIAVCEAAAMFLALVAFFGAFLHSLAGILRDPRRLRLTSLVFYMEQTGLRAVPIVALLTFLIGMVVAYMGARQLQTFGAHIFAVNLLEITVLREMAVLITAIVVAGRSGSSFTAQIGAMQANEEVDALRSMGLDPNLLLVVPRVLALILTLPLLVFLADMMALLGGALAIWYILDIDIYAFITQLYAVARTNNFLVGMIKTPFFALAIGLIGCFHGFRVSGSAESVGFLTTLAVVQSIFSVILLDALFAIFFTAIRM